jgi:hypothetical protein
MEKYNILNCLHVVKDLLFPLTSIEKVGVDHCALNIIEVGVVLEGALEQARLLAERGNVRTVVVREHLVAHDGVSHLQNTAFPSDKKIRLETPVA